MRRYHHNSFHFPTAWIQIFANQSFSRHKVQDAFGYTNDSQLLKVLLRTFPSFFSLPLIIFLFEILASLKSFRVFKCYTRGKRNLSRSGLFVYLLLTPFFFSFDGRPKKMNERFRVEKQLRYACRPRNFSSIPDSSLQHPLAEGESQPELL